MSLFSFKYMFVYIVIIQALLFMSIMTAKDINSQSNIPFFTGTTLDTFRGGGAGNYSLDPYGWRNGLPSGTGGGSVVGSILGGFTDIFSVLLNWIGTAPAFLLNLFMTPYNVLGLMNLPQLYVFGIGSMWYLAAFLSFLLFITGKE